MTNDNGHEQRRHTLNCDTNTIVSGHHRYCGCWCHTDRGYWQAVKAVQPVKKAVEIYPDSDRDAWDRVGHVRFDPPAYVSAGDVCAHCAHGNHEVMGGGACSCRCHG